MVVGQASGEEPMHDGVLARTPQTDVENPLRNPRSLVALLALILLADALFWGRDVGLSLALFAAATFVAGQRRMPRPVGLAVLIAAVLPVVEFVQPLSVVILSTGLITGLVLSRRPPGVSVGVVQAVLALMAQIPRRFVQDLVHLVAGLRFRSGTARRIGRVWALPLGGFLILMSLLAEANPILDDWLVALTDLPFDPAAWLRRLAFWVGVALVVWPLLVAEAPTVARSLPRLRPAMIPGLNAASITPALMLFNAALGLQTLLDARYLWSGASLPPGMTLAEYAHRGAYPLLATALLAGAFALAARPWVAERQGLRALLYLWLGQNILLTLSAMYRLDLYVQAYGLTYLRIHALIWMGLVAAGLALTLIQIAGARTNLWLLTRCLVLGGVTLYGAAFVNFADLIARSNVAMGKIDSAYLCSLGPTAAASVPKVAWIVENPDYDSYLMPCTLAPPTITDWRDWGFRNWRVLNSLAQQEARP